MAPKLSRIFPVRFQPDFYRQLEERAREERKPVGAVIRRACEVALGLPLQLPPSRSLPDMSLLNQLVRIGNNLNQETRLLHQLRHRELSPDFRTLQGVLEEVRQLLEQVTAQVAEANR